MLRNIEKTSPSTPLDVDPGFFGFDLSTVSLPNTISGKIITSFTIYDSIMVFMILLFVAYVRDLKRDGEVQPIFIPRRPPTGFRKYAVLLETGQSPGGGTTSVIFLRLIGKLTKTPAFSLSWSNEYGDRHLFWSQNKDIFIISVPHYLGYVEEVEILTDKTGESPPWFLRSIRVMCLDNRKCWKTTVNAWLRGDKKPFSFKMQLIGALSTRDYVAKVFLQNHLWTTMWWRKLGSYFTCKHRCVINWSSFAIAMFVAHFLTYASPYDAATVASYSPIPVEFMVRGNDAVLAGVLSALVGAIVGALLRLVVRQSTSCSEWARVDDKVAYISMAKTQNLDDFGHIMGENDLEYAEGAVVTVNRPSYTGPRLPYPPCIENDSVRDILESLTSEQRAALKKMVQCEKPKCGIKHFMDTNACCEESESNKSHEHGTDESSIKEEEVERQHAIPEEEGSESIPASHRSVSESAQDSITGSEPRVLAQERGYNKDIETEMVWMKSMRDQSGDSMENTEDLPKSSATKTNPNPSSGYKEYGRRKRLVKKRKKPVRRWDVPQVSARADLEVTDNSKLNNESKHSNTSTKHSNTPSKHSNTSVKQSKSASSKGSNKQGSQYKASHVEIPINHAYDSVSEPESDEEIVTKFTRTDSEINIRRRPAHVYDGAPLWDDRNRVYVTSPTGGEHHDIMQKRYAQTAATETNCCQFHETEGEFGDKAILHYLAEEENSPLGGVIDSDNGVADGICGLAALMAIGLPLFTLYQRMVLPDAHGLYYLYSVFMCFVMHFIFCTVDASICAILATCSRRQRVAKARGENSIFHDVTDQLQQDQSNISDKIEQLNSKAELASSKNSSKNSVVTFNEIKNT